MQITLLQYHHHSTKKKNEQKNRSKTNPKSTWHLWQPPRVIDARATKNTMHKINQNRTINISASVRDICKTKSETIWMANCKLHKTKFNRNQNNDRSRLHNARYSIQMERGADFRWCLTWSITASIQSIRTSPESNGYQSFNRYL